MDRPTAVDAARSLVAARYPRATQAWLAGSVSRGQETPSSDLDITVLLDDLQDEEVHRETLDHLGWPVELFVHIPSSMDHYVAKDLARRHPTMARLVAQRIPLRGSHCWATEEPTYAAPARRPSNAVPDGWLPTSWN